MNVLIIGKPRTRTSYLCDAYSKYYGLKNFHEVFDSASHIHDLYIRSKMLKKKDTKNYLMSGQTLFISNKVKEVFLKNNSVVKLFPRHIICKYGNLKNFDNLQRYDFLENLLDFDFDPLNDLNTLLQLPNYNKIYVLERNLVDSAISFCYAIKVNNFLFSDTPTISHVQKKYERVIYDANDFGYLNFAIFEHLILEKLKVYVAQKFNYTNLDFDDVPKYVDTTFPNLSKSDYIDPKFNYKEIITNYDEVKHYINTAYAEFSARFDHIIFS